MSYKWNFAPLVLADLAGTPLELIKNMLQLEVLRRRNYDIPNAEIAAELNIAVATVATYFRRARLQIAKHPAYARVPAGKAISSAEARRLGRALEECGRLARPSLA